MGKFCVLCSSFHFLQIPQWVAAGCRNVSFNVHPKCQDHVNNDRGAKRKKGDVHEPHTNAGSGYPHPVSNSSAYSKGLPFNKIFQTVHSSNIDVFTNTEFKNLLKTSSVFSNFAPLLKRLK